LNSESYVNFEFEFGIVTFDIRFQLAGSEVLGDWDATGMLFASRCTQLSLMPCISAASSLPIHHTLTDRCWRQSWPRHLIGIWQWH